MISRRSTRRTTSIHSPTTPRWPLAAGRNSIESAQGCYVTDRQGRRLLDGLAGLWCVNVGYGREEIVSAVTEQTRRLPYYCSFFNSTTEPAVRLAAALANLDIIANDKLVEQVRDEVGPYLIERRIVRQSSQQFIRRPERVHDPIPAAFIRFWHDGFLLGLDEHPGFLQQLALQLPGGPT